MIGTKCAPGLPAEPAETPHVESMGIPATPNGRRVSSYTKRYTDGWECETTLFDVGDAESASMTVDCGADGSRFGFALDREAEKVAVSSRPNGLSVSFAVRRWFEEGLDKRSVVLPATASVELVSEISAVSSIEETHTGTDAIASFFEDETSDDPWLVVVEPD